MRSALIRLDIRNAWCVGESHPDPWQLEDLLPPRGARKQAESGGGNSPEALAWYKAFQIRCSIAMANKQWDWGGQPEVFPLPS